MSQGELLSVERVQQAAAECQSVLDAVNGIIMGKPELVKLTFATILAGGHALLEGLPGLGKTVLAKSFARALGVGFRRIQFTPDLLPSDITGSYMLDESERGRELRFYPGPVFTNLLLADEINRASPKTQSALLEAMSEYQVTQMGNRMALERPFCVLATQNPIEMEGTYPLPEAQMDRFALKLLVDAADTEVLKSIITERRTGEPPEPPQVTDRDGLLRLQQTVNDVFLPVAMAEHISSVVEMTHPTSASAPPSVKESVRYGSSPRGAIWLSRVAKAFALMDGRPAVGFDDVRHAAPSALGHRLILHHRARLDGRTGRELAREVVELSEKRILEP